MQKNILGTAPVGKLMVKFAVPSIIAMLVGAIYNIVDQLFIGNYVSTLGNAATNVVFPLTSACIAIALLFGIGGASCFNLDMGKGDTEKAPYYVGNAITAMTIGGVLLAVFTLVFLTPILKFLAASDNVMPYAKDYLMVTAIGFPFLIITTGGGHLMRADGSPKMTMFCSMLGAVLNIFLDALFVIVFKWGMKGAALATIIGQFISAMVVIWYLTRFKTVKLKLKHFVPKFKICFRAGSIGMASFINQLAMMVVQILINNSYKIYGAMSVYGTDIPITCAGIIMKTAQIIFSVVIGISQGAQPIESFNYGARKYDRVKSAYWWAFLSSGVISIFAFLAFQIFPREILSLFGQGSELYFEFGVMFCRIYMFFIFINFIQPITSTFFTAIGKPIKGTILSLSKNIICFVPFLLILPRFFGINGIVYAGPCADVVAVALNVILITIEFKKMKK
ncbi:MAG: MATE family efflux transporter, partial [Clostridia bacterium]|nr:MATE family efflux transporter [Clostridia bacterium]